MHESDDAKTLNPSELAVAIEEGSRAKISQWWQFLGQPAEYPASTETVIELLRAVEYEADADTLIGYVNEGIMPSPPRNERGQLAWTATHIICAGTMLEQRRRWQPFSNLHAAKMTPIEKLEQLHAHRGDETFSDLAEFDLERLLALLVDAAMSPAIVVILARAIRHKLKLKGVM